MRSKSLNAVLLAFSVVLEGAILLTVSNPWWRLTLGLWLLALIIVFASQVKMPGLIGELSTTSIRRRQFPLLRKTTGALLDQVRRLNWLVVDMDRGFRDRDTVKMEIQATERRMAELLIEIRKTAGRMEPDPDAHPTETPTMPVGEPQQGTDAG